MKLGSGDTTALLSGKHTKTHNNLLQKFVNPIKQVYNAFASPIDALRTGAILEERFFSTLGLGWVEQYVADCKEMDVLKASIDFAYFEDGKLVDFKELKTCNFNDFLNFEPLRNAEYDEYIKFIKKKYKNNYNQVQQQLLCTGLDKAHIVFLAVYSYEDEVNWQREIQENEYIVFEVHRDEEVIKLIKERASIFQQIRNFYEENKHDQ